jgi:hypothetical protein
MGTVVGLLMGWAGLEIWGTIYILRSVFFWKILKYVHTFQTMQHLLGIGYCWKVQKALDNLM